MPSRDFSSYLFLGEEEFLKEDSIEKLKSEFLDNKTKELNYSVFHAGERNFDLKLMLDTLNTLPFLSKKRIVVLKDADSLTASQKQSVLLYLASPRSTSLFVISSSAPVIKGGFFLEASKLARLVYCRRLRGADINTWLVKKAASSGKKISAAAINAVKENLPNDIRVLSSSMDNIILYAGKKPAIEKDDVESVIGPNPSRTAFDLIDRIEKKDIEGALRVFSALQKDRKRETELLGLLAWNARMLLRVKELLRLRNRAQIQKDLSLNPRVFDRVFHHVSKLTKARIMALLSEILASDLDIKRGNPPSDVMRDLIIRMCL